jgi:L-amino acid N-acyltransferase YncA
MSEPAVIVEQSNGASDLDGILALQRLNLRGQVPEAEAKSQGFVTVAHTREVLASMHARMPSIVARRGESIVGYALAMPLESRAEVPILAPMFALFDTLRWEGRPLPTVPYYVMGQICVAASERGSGLFDRLYSRHQQLYADRFELLVTEISLRNTRSQRAHARVGFVELARYSDATDTWLVVGWPLREHEDPRNSGNL